MDYWFLDPFFLLLVWCFAAWLPFVIKNQRIAKCAWFVNACLCAAFAYFVQMVYAWPGAAALAGVASLYCFYVVFWGYPKPRITLLEAARRAWKRHPVRRR